MQRQLRLGDILDDYCPRERRVNEPRRGRHGRSRRCQTDALLDLRDRTRIQARQGAASAAEIREAGGPVRAGRGGGTQARRPRAGARNRPGARNRALAPRRRGCTHGRRTGRYGRDGGGRCPRLHRSPGVASASPAEDPADGGDAEEGEELEEGPVHRQLIRATLPRIEGQPPPTRPAPEFTIRQPGGAAGRPIGFVPGISTWRRRRRPAVFWQSVQWQHERWRVGARRYAPTTRGRQPQGPQGPSTSRLGRRNGPGRKPSK